MTEKRKHTRTWAVFSEAVDMLKECQSYTQSYIIPEDRWMEIQTILMYLQKEDLPEAMRKAVESLLELCPHGRTDKSKCDRCWDKTMEWI